MGLARKGLASGILWISQGFSHFCILLTIILVMKYQYKSIIQCYEAEETRGSGVVFYFAVVRLNKM